MNSIVVTRSVRPFMANKFIFNMRGAAVVCHYMPRTAPVTILVTQSSSNELNRLANDYTKCRETESDLV